MVGVIANLNDEDLKKFNLRQFLNHCEWMSGCISIEYCCERISDISEHDTRKQEKKNVFSYVAFRDCGT